MVLLLDDDGSGGRVEVSYRERSIAVSGAGFGEETRSSSSCIMGEKLLGARAGRDGCVVVSLASGDDRTSASMRALAAARSEAVGSGSMYGRESWTAVVSAIVCVFACLLVV